MRDVNDLNVIAAHARALMDYHGLGRVRFEFDRGKRRRGACHFKRVGPTPIPVKITLSSHFAKILTMDEIRTTILHEIAHAQAGHAAGHGPVWKAKAKALGIAGDRCGSSSVSPAPSWVAYCKKCGEKCAAQHRAPLVVRVHRCDDSPEFDRTLVWHKNGKPVDASAMPERYRRQFAHVLKNAAIAAVKKEKI